MAGKLPVEILSYDSLRKRADAFLERHHPDGTIPVPIEELVEFQFDVDIIPTPGLHRGFDIDGFITSDLKNLYVDEFVFESRPGRYRFTLAHEIAHAVLHKAVFRELQFNSIRDWKRVVLSLPRDQHAWIEWQAYAFAGLILVPRAPLVDRFGKVVARLAKLGLSISRASDAARHAIAEQVAREFDVSRQVIEIRLQKDELWPKSR